MFERLIIFVSSNPELSIVFLCILFLIVLIIGYLIGNNSLSRKNNDYIDKELDALKYEVSFRTSIIDNVNLGVIAYNEKGLVYQNSQVLYLKEFLPLSNEQKSFIPRTIEEFLTTYDVNNHLKSKYILNSSINNSESRANYQTDHKVYEIRVIHRIHDNSILDIVIIDDITELQDYERRQKDIAANVSHELKTPLTVLRASEFFINSIKPDNMPSYEDLMKWGNRIVVNSVRMEDMVQNLLYLSMCAQQVPMQIIDVGDIINKALSDVSDYPGRDNVEIITPEISYYPLVYGNMRLITLVVKNLLTNAIKYINYEGKTEPNRIRIEVSQIENKIGIQVNDNGRGIPEKSKNDLFERFYRVDNSGSHDVGGTGIGLSIVKEVADMHESTIYVDSELKVGSTFTLMLSQASDVFEEVYQDAKTGVTSEKQYLKSAAEFMALNAIEAVKSLGYEDVKKESDDFESAPTGDTKAHEDALIALLSKLGDERYSELVEELTYIDPEEFDDYEEDEDIESYEDDFDMNNSSEEEIDFNSLQEKASEILIMQEEEERIRQQKEEARRLLTQTILPRATTINNPEEVAKEEIKPEVNITSSKNAPKISPIIENKDKNSSETKMIHPKKAIKLYNNNDKNGGRKSRKSEKASSDVEKKAVATEPERQSSLKMVLDNTVPIKVANKNDEGEQL